MMYRTVLLTLILSFQMVSVVLGSSDKIWIEPLTQIEFVRIPSQCYLMGTKDIGSSSRKDETPKHEVCLSPFWMGRYEVTNLQYRQFQKNHDSGSYQSYDLSKSQQPVVQVSWEMAKAYAQWLTRRHQNQYQFRLPTEAEWELTCIANQETHFLPWKTEPSKACEYASVFDQMTKEKFGWWATPFPCKDGFPVSASIGSFKPNAFNLYDILGNVWEWTEDVYQSDAYSKHLHQDPLRGGSGKERVQRGGSWSVYPQYISCKQRRHYPSKKSFYNLGFRLVMQPLIPNPELSKKEGRR